MRILKIFLIVILSLVSFSAVSWAYDITQEDSNTMSDFQTVDLSFNLENEGINALAVKLKAEGMTIQNVEIIDEDLYLVLPECSNGDIFTSGQICFSIASEEAFVDATLFAKVDVSVIEPGTAKFIKLEGNAYSDGEEEYRDSGEFSVSSAAQMGEESVQEPAVVSTDELDYGTQVYIAASVLILLVFISSMIVVFDDQYSANLKLGASFVGLLLLVFALYGAYSTYSKTTDVSVAELGATCYDVIDKVCGTDGRTYRNDCLAEAAGVEVACKGECPCSEGSSASFYGTSCGNGVCESGEDVFRTIDKYSGLTAGCPQDCIVCGDGICDIGEADVDTCDTGTSRESTDLKRHCEAKEGTCPADCKAIAQETAVCGVMDKNGDGKLTIVDFAAFVKVYQKKCVSAAASLDTSAKTGCGNQDTNSDGVINLIDFSSFVKRYNKASCALTAQ